MEILFLTTVMPDGRTTGGEVASQAVVDALGRHGHDVTVLGYRRPSDAASGDERLVEAGRRAIETDTAGVRQKGGWLATAALHRLPYSAAKYRSRRYRRALLGLLEHRRFDLAILDHAQSGWVLPELLRASPRLAALLHNVEHRIYDDRAAAAGFAGGILLSREARLVRALEARVAEAAAAIWVLADDDAEHFASLASEVRTLSVPPASVPPRPAPEQSVDVALIGTWTWELTKRGLEWFVGRVCPLLPSRLRVEVAGRGADWIRQAAPAVRYRGFVPDAMEFLSAARVVAVPSLGGSGVQVKTLDAIASGARVVTTPAGIRGLGTLPPSVRVAETAESFAAELTEAADTQRSPEESIPALDWARARRERFLADVGAAAEAAAGRS